MHASLPGCMVVLAVGQGEDSGTLASGSGPATGSQGDRDLPKSDTKDPALP